MAQERVFQYLSTKYTEVQNALDPDNVGKQFVFVGQRETHVGILEQIHERQIIIRYNTRNADGTTSVIRIISYPVHFRLYKLSDMMDNANNPVEQSLINRLGGTKKIKKSKKVKKLKYKKTRK